MYVRGNKTIRHTVYCVRLHRKKIDEGVLTDKSKVTPSIFLFQ